MHWLAQAQSNMVPGKYQLFWGGVKQLFARFVLINSF